MSRGRAFGLAVLVLAAGAGSWGLYYGGELGRPQRCASAGAFVPA